MFIIINNINKVLAEDWDKNLGGKNFDYGISKHLMDVFDSSPDFKKTGKPSVKGDYKILEKILPNAIKYKEVLSANKVSIVNVLGVSNGINLKVLYYI